MALALVNDVAKIKGPADEPGVEVRKRPAGFGVDKYSVQEVEVLVAGCAVNRPGWPERLISAQDFFHHNIKGRTRAAAR